METYHILMISFAVRYLGLPKGEMCMDFDLKEIIELICKRVKFIILITFLTTGLTFAFYKYIRQPIYTASVQLYVNPNDSTSAANLNELNYAQKIVSTYINLLRTHTFYRQVLDATGLNYSENQLKSMTQINAVNNTEIFQIRVSSNSASDSYTLVEAMQNIAPQLIANIIDNAKISIVDPVVFPKGPSGPNVLLNTMAGAVAGLFISIAMSFLWELIDVNVKNKDDLTKKYQLPILGIIPSFDGVISKKQRLLRKLPFSKKLKSKVHLNQVIKQEANFLINEAYKALRTNLLYTIRKSGCKKILVNSPNPMDGKSTTCTNIGIAIAKTGAKVLLIDCDLRKGKLHTPFYVNSTPGLSNILSGMKTDKEVIQSTPYENLQIIACGSIAPNPTELLSSMQMEELIKKLESNYDYIIIDSAPVNVVADALSLAKIVDGVLLVVRENCTTYPNIETALNKYELIGGNILGFVLNGSTPETKSKSKYYYNSKND